MVNYKFCPMCSYSLSEGSKIEPFSHQNQKRDDEIDDEIDNQVIRKTIIKKKLSDKQINALAETRKKMAAKRLLAKQEKDEQTTTKTEIKNVEDENKKVEEIRKEKNKEFVNNSSFRRKLF